jgi:predicted amidohydrolase
MRIACCQIAPDVIDPAASAQRATDAIRAAIADGAEIVILPELVLSGYVFASQDEANAAAIPPESPLLQAWSEHAARSDALVIGGFAEKAADGTLFNSLAVVDRAGVVAVYRKLHLWGDEPRWFQHGQDPAPVIDTRFGRIGLAVCYDIEFPELTRGLALQGAELIVIPANWPHGEQPMLHELARTTAYLNRVFVAVCDRCGTERGLEFEGGSVIAAPDGRALAGAAAGHRGEATLTADVDLTEARDKRNGPHNDAFADRRADHYVAELANRARG